MAARPIWKGYLKLSLVSVPVKAYTVADNTHSHIRLNQLHAPCNQRIRYQKTCPEHGEVPSDEIISAYQVGKDQYVPIDPDELSALRPHNDQSIEIDAFIAADELDDRFLTERSYFLIPDGKVAHKPYCLIRDAMLKDNRRAIAEVILSRREQHVLVRPLGKLLMMTVLQHQDELKAPAEFEEQVEEAKYAAQELQMAKQLVEGMQPENWDFADYTDDYEQKLGQLIEAKLEGKELVDVPESEAPQIINLMDALKASIEQIPVPGSTSKKSSSKKSDSSGTESDGTKPDGTKPSATKSTRKAAASRPRSGTKRTTSKRKSG